MYFAARVFLFLLSVSCGRRVLSPPSFGIMYSGCMLGAYLEKRKKSCSEHNNEVRRLRSGHSRLSNFCQDGHQCCQLGRSRTGCCAMFAFKIATSEGVGLRRIAVGRLRRCTLQITSANARVSLRVVAFALRRLLPGLVLLG